MQLNCQICFILPKENARFVQKKLARGAPIRLTAELQFV